MKRQGSLFVLLVGLLTLLVTGCSSNTKKLEMRDRVVASSGLACEFVNGEQHRQVELELNISMAKRCDLDKPYTITDYKTSADVTGLVYCCRIKEGSAAPAKTGSK